MMVTERAGYAELNSILDRARRSSTAPIALTDPQLVGLQLRWAAALSARLDAVLEAGGPAPILTAVADAWTGLSSEHATLRRLLDAHEDTSAALAEAQGGELRMLALAAGLCGVDDPESEAVWRGRAYRVLIRSGGRKPVESTPRRLFRRAKVH